MPNYIYTNTFGSNEFEGNLNQILARREAEQRFGKGGRLFREVPSSTELVDDKTREKIAAVLSRDYGGPELLKKYA
ncbi:MAG: hypothetical protein WC735_01210 [Candidatus Paceibacterota bacterium]|jgi:hypothetical protein